MERDDEQLLTLIDGLGSPSVLVFGDLILDRYTWGRVERISPEAPVPVLACERVEERLGGAAAVASLLAALGASVTCVGFAGRDREGRRLRRLLENASVRALVYAADDDRPTTVKERFGSVRHGQAQLLRVDRESTAPVPPRTEARVVADLDALVAGNDAVLIADYAKGACTSGLLWTLIDRARAQGVPLLVDPARAAAYTDYRGATLVKPNRHEAALATGLRVATPEDALATGHRLCDGLDLAAAVVTLDSDGMVLACADGREAYLPTSSRAVYDITGAGDTVLAMLGMAMASGLPLLDACRLANVAGGIQVQRIGVARITRDDLRAALDESAAGLTTSGVVARRKIATADQAAALAASARVAGKSVVFTNGCFAAFHAGHLAYLREARALGDLLVVAINSQESIARLKGARPTISDADRAAMLAALDVVDCVVVFDDDEPTDLIRHVRPDVLVKGGTTDYVIGREVVEAYGGSVRVLSAVAGVSTTSLLATACREPALAT